MVDDSSDTVLPQSSFENLFALEAIPLLRRAELDIRKPNLAIVKRQLRNYARLRSLVDRWIDLAIELSDLQLQEAKQAAAKRRTLLAPLSRGQHEIHFEGAAVFTLEEDGFDFTFMLDITYDLSVTRGRLDTLSIDEDAAADTDETGRLQRFRRGGVRLD